MKTRGKGLKKEIWFSICSRHAIHDENCEMCNSGVWVNVIKNYVSGIIYNLCPKIWCWLVKKNIITASPMTDKDKLTLKWIIIITVIVIAVAVMYYKNRPIKEVEQVKEFPSYKMY